MLKERETTVVREFWNVENAGSGRGDERYIYFVGADVAWVH